MGISGLEFVARHLSSVIRDICTTMHYVLILIIAAKTVAAQLALLPEESRRNAKEQIEGILAKFLVDHFSKQVPGRPHALPTTYTIPSIADLMQDQSQFSTSSGFNSGLLFNSGEPLQHLHTGVNY